jgi:hypothetical protein
VTPASAEPAAGPGTLHRRALFAVEVVLLAVAVWLRFVHLDADIPAQQNADDLGDEGYWFVPARDLIRFGTFDAATEFLQAQVAAPITTLTLAALGHALGRFDYTVVHALPALYSSLTLLLGLFYFDRLKRMPLAAVCFLGLYGLLPVTLFYARIGHVEPHLLFYLFAAFVIVERARTTRALLAAGVTASFALAVKSVAVFVLPALALYVVVHHRERPLVALGAFLGGAAPGVLAYGAYVAMNAERFAPTLAAVATYYRKPGFFVDASSIEYFWLAPLVRPYLPWLAVGLALVMLLPRRDDARTWMIAWLATALIVMSLFRYQSYARHMLVLFPLLLSTALAFGHLHERVRGPAAVTLSVVCVLALAASIVLSTAVIGRSVFLAPRFTYRDAARTLAAMTGEHDRVVGVHAHALSVAGRYRPKMSLNASNWRGVDPLAHVDPTVALIATRFNGRPRTGGWDRVFPRRAQFRWAERLDGLEYLDGRFALDVYRVFASADEHRTFQRFRQGRPSRYDGLLHGLYRDDLETGCLVKGALVAESRGDPEISHRKVSATGCAGMMGFCYQTAAGAHFADIFQRLVPGIRPGAVSDAVFEADDRFAPDKALRAGARFLGDVRGRFAPYTDRVQLTFAAYNAGPAFVAFLVERARTPDPRWERDLLPILQTLDRTSVPGYERWSRAARAHKFRVETPRYVDDAARTFDACLRGTSFMVSYGPERSTHEDGADKESLRR